MTNRLLRTFALLVALLAVVFTASAPSTVAATPAVVAVRVDGALYSRAQYAQRFGSQDLHWVVDEAARAQGILTAFTTEARRNTALGIREAYIQPSGGPSISVHYATLWASASRGGSQVIITGNAYNLNDQGFDNVATSVETFSRGVVLYEYTYHQGCSLYVQSYKYISHLANHDFCGAFTGDWNNKTSSVAAVG